MSYVFVAPKSVLFYARKPNMITDTSCRLAVVYFSDLQKARDRVKKKFKSKCQVNFVNNVCEGTMEASRLLAFVNLVGFLDKNYLEDYGLITLQAALVFRLMENDNFHVAWMGVNEENSDLT